MFGHALDETLDRGQRLVLTLLLGEARVPGEVGERDRYPQPAGDELLVPELQLHVADYVLLDVVTQESPMDVVHERRREGQQIPREPLHLVGHLKFWHALPHERVMHVEVE